MPIINSTILEIQALIHQIFTSKILLLLHHQAKILK